MNTYGGSIAFFIFFSFCILNFFCLGIFLIFLCLDLIFVFSISYLKFFYCRHCLIIAPLINWLISWSLCFKDLFSVTKYLSFSDELNSTSSNFIAAIIRSSFLSSYTLEYSPSSLPEPCSYMEKATIKYSYTQTICDLLSKNLHNFEITEIHRVKICILQNKNNVTQKFIISINSKKIYHLFMESKNTFVLHKELAFVYVGITIKLCIANFMLFTR